MNPQMLSLALDTPLDELLGLPQAVQIAYSIREDLSGYSKQQMQALLGCINGMIEFAIQTARTRVDDGQVERADNRDLDWLLDAVVDEYLLVPAGMGRIAERDYYRVFSLYSLGCAITASLRDKRTTLTEPAVTALMDAQEARLLADLLPERRTLEDEVAEAWYRGLTPDPDVSDQIKESHSRAAQHAANIRHTRNRQAKSRAIEIYFANEYSSIDVAAEIIAQHVFRAPGTVRKWIFAARRERGLTA